MKYKLFFTMLTAGMISQAHQPLKIDLQTSLTGQRTVQKIFRKLTNELNRCENGMNSIISASNGAIEIDLGKIRIRCHSPSQPSASCNVEINKGRPFNRSGPPALPAPESPRPSH